MEVIRLAGLRRLAAPLAALLCGAIANVVIANVLLAETAFPFVEMAKPRLALDAENVSIFNITCENGPFIICGNMLDVNIAYRCIESNNLSLAGRYIHISRNDNFRISCNIFLR